MDVQFIINKPPATISKIVTQLLLRFTFIFMLKH